MPADEQFDAILFESDDYFDTKLTNVTFLGEVVKLPKIYYGSKNENKQVDETGYYPGGPHSKPGKSHINIISNFPEAKKILLNGMTLGHVLAPNADVYQYGGNYNGGVIARNYYTTSEGHFWPLDFQDKHIEKIDYTVIKKWQNIENIELPAIKINLLQKDKVIDTIVLDGSEDWTYTWTDLEKYDENGKEYKYAVEEVETPEGFISEVDGNVIVNTFVDIKPEIEYRDFTVLKKWENVDQLDLPSIKVNLNRNGEVFKTIELDGSEDWTYTWTDLEKYDENGKEYKYTVEEVETPEGFISEVDGNVIVNTFVEIKPEIEYRDFTVIKKWENVDQLDLPSIKVNLNRNGEVFKTIELDGSEDWTYTWTGLEKYDENGKEYEYTVEEVEIPEGFISEVDGNVIVNTYVKSGQVLPATGALNLSLFGTVSIVLGGLYLFFKKN